MALLAPGRAILALALALVLLCHAHALVLPASGRTAFAPVRLAIAPRAAPSMTVLNINGKKIDVPAGSNLGKACEKGGLKPKYSCKKGECGSCTVTVGGTRMKACVEKVPPPPKLKSLLENGLVVR
ncbi:hypothetical protein KFE25_000095 [Diacronema lutheri]|uniref:2Fe-2S ferredoxin-type domain-containing protein n=1 Tax=Diacronema lutheri TaxID=2081491 RepID=A0A8J6C6W1_DIALT|nr:hypothetical protein KFE25_000095 [Diacronema lutheri]